MIKFLLCLLLIPCLAWPYGGMGPGPGFKTYSGGSAYLLEEEFGAQGDWINDLGGDGTANYNNTTSPLSGGAMLTITVPGTGSRSKVRSPDVTASSDVYIAFMLQADVISSSDILEIYDATNTYLCGVKFDFPYLAAVSVSDTTDKTAYTTLSVATPYYIKARYTASGNITVWSSSTGTNGDWTEAGSIASGSTTDATYIKLVNEGWSIVTDFDNVKISTTDIDY